MASNMTEKQRIFKKVTHIMRMPHKQRGRLKETEDQLDRRYKESGLDSKHEKIISMIGEMRLKH